MINNWTIGILTIPSRDLYLRRLINSLNQTQQGVVIKVLYNCLKNEQLEDLASGVSRDYRGVEVLYATNDGELKNSADESAKESYRREFLFQRQKKYGISQARNQLLRSVETPLIAFLDDDCTLEGKDVFTKLEDSLRRTFLGFIGIPSYYNDSDIQFKPRIATPKQKIDGIVYTNVSGNFAASYARLLRDLKGFNERKNRLEWADLNTRLQREGYPTGIDMDAGLIRHWADAPDSLTTMAKNRHLEMLYSLFSTALEFDCNGLFLASRKMWELVIADGNYQGELSQEQLLIDIYQVLHQIIEDKEEIEKYRDYLRSLPFSFMPFEPISLEEWQKLIEYSKPKIEKYKTELK